VLSIAEQIVSRQIDEALTKNHVSTSSRIRAEIEARVDWDSVSVSSVSVCDDSNRVMTVDAYLNELRNDARYKADFPEQAQRVSRRDIAKLRDHFDQICDGTVVVE
jgi:hypothetical protein